MKLPLLTPKEVNQVALRAEDAIKNTNSRSSHLLIVENAIREAQSLIIEKLDVKVQNHYFVDLSKS